MNRREDGGVSFETTPQEQGALSELEYIERVMREKGYVRYSVTLTSRSMGEPFFFETYKHRGRGDEVSVLVEQRHGAARRVRFFREVTLEELRGESEPPDVPPARPEEQ